MDQITDIRLASRQISFGEIPMIDIAPLIDDSDPQGVARSIGEACEQVGFFYIRNHGVPADLVDRMYQVTRQFFDLPFEVKDRLNVANSGPTLRGYIPMYAENVAPGDTRDFKECFDFGLDSDIVSPFSGPNQMPSEPASFTETCNAYHDAMLKLARKLTSAIAQSLDLPPDYFEKLQRNPITIQRLLHYPPQTGPVSQEEIGIGAHTDYGFLTILSQDAVGGLQVRNRAGEWVSAPPIDGSFIINIGDLVQTFTNDRYISTLHRVINSSKVERYSLPFFIDLDFDALVEPVPTCFDERALSSFVPYTCGQHKYRRFVDSYPHLQHTAGT